MTDWPDATGVAHCEPVQVTVRDATWQSMPQAFTTEVAPASGHEMRQPVEDPVFVRTIWAMYPVSHWLWAVQVAERDPDPPAELEDGDGVPCDEPP